MSTPLPSRSARALALLLPAVAALLLFAPVLDGGFVYDDQVLLEDNPALRSWSAVVEGFQIPFWLITADPRRAGAGFYRPLSIAAFTVLWKAGGGDPLPFHAASWLLHAACAALVAGLGLRLGWRPLAAGAAGLFFAAYGGHAEAVAWASSLPDLLATFFSLLAVGALVRGRPAACALWLLPALLAKEAALGALVLCFAAGMLQKDQRARYAAWLAGVFLVVWALRALAFDSLLAGFDREIIRGMHLASGQRLVISLAVLARYCAFLVWPWPHAPFHPLELGLEASDIAWWGPAAAGGLFLVLAAGLWAWRARSCSIVRIPLGLLLAALLPVLNLRALGQFPFEERFLYLPSAGFALLAAALLLGRAGRLEPGRPRLRAGVGLAVLLAACAGNAWSAASTLQHWKDPQSFFKWAAESAPEAMTSWLGVGALYMERAQSIPVGPGRIAAAKAAQAAFERALAVDPDRWLVITIDREQGNIGLANSMFLQGEVLTAQNMYRQILERFPDSVEANLGLAASLATEGDRYMGQMNREEAETRFLAALPLFDKVLEVLPASPEALNGKGACLAYMEYFSDARPLLERALELQPDNFFYLRDLVEVLLMLEPGAACRAIRDFLAANPSSPYLELLRRMQREAGC